MTVRDLATLARRIISDFPEYFKYYSEREFEYAGHQAAEPQSAAAGRRARRRRHEDRLHRRCRLRARRHRPARRPAHHLGDGGPADRPASDAPRASACWSTASASSRNTGCLRPAAEVASADVWLGVVPTVPLTVTDTVASPCPRGAQGSGGEADLRQPDLGTGGQGPGDRSVEVTAPGAAPLTEPLVAAVDVPRAGMLGRATGAISYLIWGRAGDLMARA